MASLNAIIVHHAGGVASAIGQEKKLKIEMLEQIIWLSIQKT